MVSIFCSACGASVRLGDERCRVCDRLVTAAEKVILRERLEAADPDAAQDSNSVVSARFLLAVASGSSLVEGVVYGWAEDSLGVFSFFGLASVLFLGLHVWSRRRTAVPLTLAVIAYLGVQLLGSLVTVWINVIPALALKTLLLFGMGAGALGEFNLRRRERP